MESDFFQFIEKHSLFEKQDRILLGISGGIDSICMFHLFRSAGYHIGVAHCNFMLRGEESEQDEIFVRNLANTHDIPFFTTKFNTSEVANKQGISIQMAARDLRYDWFYEIKNQYDYNYIAIAHNKDDIIETFLINLSRGSGIKGLTGIKPKTKEIIRPLLFASREDIEKYCMKCGFDFREDSSNKTTKYSRNLIRHEIIPLFEEINPNFRGTMINNIDRLKQIEKIYLNNISNNMGSIVREENQYKYIDIEGLKKLEPLHTYLHEILHPYGFTTTQIENIIDSLDGIPGKQFYSLTHRLVKDRSELILNEISVNKKNTYFINFDTDYIETPVKLSFSNFNLSPGFKIIKRSSVGLFDFNKIEYPLTLRKWKNGDYFMPLGMKTLKKLSDYFIDNKFSITQKENTWILESGNKIIWIIGHRIDERFKITPQTSKILKIELLDS